jgi:hypothetical protein
MSDPFQVSRRELHFARSLHSSGVTSIFIGHGARGSRFDLIGDDRQVRAFHHGLLDKLLHMQARDSALQDKPARRERHAKITHPIAEPSLNMRAQLLDELARKGIVGGVESHGTSP